MSDQFDNIIKQAKAIVNPEQTVNKMDVLEAKNEVLLEHAIHAEANAVCLRYEIKHLKAFIERLAEADEMIVANAFESEGRVQLKNIQAIQSLVAEYRASVAKMENAGDVK